MGKRSKEETEEEQAAAELAAKKAAKKAKKAAAAAAAEEEEEDPAAAKKAKKAKKAAAAAAAEEEEEDPEAAALAAKKAAKKAKKAAAAAAAEEEEEDPEAAKKAAKKAKKAAAAAEEDEDEEEPVKKAPSKPADDDDGQKGKKGDNDLTVFVRGLPFSTTEDVLRKDFAECGELVACRMLLNDEGNCRGLAFIEYADKEGLEKALAFNETEYGGRTIYCSKASDKPEGKGKSKGGKGDNALTVFVRGLPFSTTEDVLKKDFAECGEIKNCRMLLNEEGNCRGLAFIEYADKEGMDKALAFNETDYGGRTIYCSPAGEGGKGKGKDGKDGKGKGKDKGKGKGKKGKAPSAAFAKSSGAMVESTGKKQTFDDSDDE